MIDGLRFARVGDSAILLVLEHLEDEAANAALLSLYRHLSDQRLPQLEDLVPGARTLLVVFRPGIELSQAQLESFLQLPDAPTPLPRPLLEVPVSYGGDAGPDLEELARVHGLHPQEVIDLHAGATYTVAFVGFSPGFPYLLGLPPRLETPRLATPRTHVPPGSVAIGGPYTGIYPTATPGGWRLIGRTGLELFDPLRNPPALLMPGGRLRFIPIRDGMDGSMTAPPSPPTLRRSPDASMRVRHPGLFTTVQDLGRPGQGAMGIPPSGAMDPWSLRLANRLVGNPDDDAGLEITLVGPELEFLQDAVVALTGSRFDARLDSGEAAPHAAAFRVRRGQVLALGRSLEGARAWIAVRGGIAVPEVLRSRATYVSGGWGGLEGRPLKGGELVPIGIAGLETPLRRVLPDQLPVYQPTCRVRVIPGPHEDAFTEGARAAFYGVPYQVSARSDRTGLRLQGPPLPHLEGADLPPEGLVFGAIQVPGDGQPIVLGCDRPATGGYARIATVIRADLWRLAQAKPGDRLSFCATGQAEAADLLRELEARLAGTVASDP